MTEQETQKEKKKAQLKAQMGCFLVLLIPVVIIVGVFSFIGKGGEESTSGTSESMATVQSRNFVKMTLKSPSTAKFPRFEVVASDLGNDTYMISSYVDAQNSFGATIRNSWAVKLRYLGGDDADISNWNLLEMTMDGKSLY